LVCDRAPRQRGFGPVSPEPSLTTNVSNKSGSLLCQRWGDLGQRVSSDFHPAQMLASITLASNPRYLDSSLGNRNALHPISSQSGANGRFTNIRRNQRAGLPVLVTFPPRSQYPKKAIATSDGKSTTTNRSHRVLTPLRLRPLQGARTPGCP